MLRKRSLVNCELIAKDLLKISSTVHGQYETTMAHLLKHEASLQFEASLLMCTFHSVYFMIDAASVIVGHRDPESGNAAQTGVLYLGLGRGFHAGESKTSLANQHESTRFIWIPTNSS